MKLRFKIVFLMGTTEVTSIEGIKETDGEHLTLAEMEQIVPTEQFLEKLLGFQVHIEQVA